MFTSPVDEQPGRPNHEGGKGQVKEVPTLFVASWEGFDKAVSDMKVGYERQRTQQEGQECAAHDTVGTFTLKQ